MSEAASAFVSLVPSARGFSSKLEAQISSPMQKSGSKMGGLLGGGIASGLAKAAAPIAAVAGIGSVLNAGFRRLNNLDQARAKLAGLGNSTKTVDRIMSNALKSVKNTAFGLDSAATVAASAVAAGIKPGKQLTTTLKTIGDTATIAGASLEDTGAIFNSVLARGKLQGDDLMQLQSRGVPVLQFLAKHYGITAQAASEMVSKGQVDFKNFSAAMKENLGGAALKSGDTFSGALANMKASLGRIGANLLSGVFPLAQKGMVKLTAAFGKVEPVATKVGKAIADGIGELGPLLQRLGAQIGPAVGDVIAKIGPTLRDLGQSLATNVVPILQTMAQTFTTKILPAVVSVVSYVGSSLLPIFQQVGQIIASNVLPIFASLGEFLFGKVYPAIVSIYSAVAVKLKPVFDALVSTFKSSVLPTIQNLLVQFRQWQPTLEKIALVVVKVGGKLAELAAAILAKVLPPVIKLAGWLIANLVPAVAKVIGVVIGAVGAVVDFGAAVGRLVGKVASAIKEVVAKFVGLEGKVVGALKGAASWLVGIGKDIVHGLIKGIGSLKDAVVDALLALIPGPLKKFAGRLGINSPSKVYAKLAESIPEGIALGISRGHGMVDAAMTRLTARLAGSPSTSKMSAAAKKAAAAAKKARDAALAQALKVAKTKADFKAWSVKTLLPGLQGSPDKVASSASALGSKLQSAMLALAGPSKKKQKQAIANAAAFMKSIKAQTDALAKNAKDRASVADQLKAAQDKLADAIQIRDDYIKQVSDSAKSFGSILSTAFDDDTPLTGSSIVANLTSKLEAIKSFAANLKTLLADGLSQANYQQLVDAGVDGGSAYAQALLDSPDLISTVNDLTQQIGDQADALGKSAGTTLYQGGVDAAQSFADGLQAKLDGLTAAGSKMAQAVLAGIDKELGIKAGVKVAQPGKGTGSSKPRIDAGGAQGTKIIQLVMPNGRVLLETVVDENNRVTRQTGRNPMVA